ncbi:MAG: serine hydrolase domain-containing protein [Xanthomonadales bacterium]|nr:serine hydrolase domain-containing protein [Xanthomonadales bacterium]
MRKTLFFLSFLVVQLAAADGHKNETGVESGPDYSHPEVRGALSAIDAWIEGTRLYDRVPGISVGIVHDQELVWHKGYGVSNRDTGRPADADTLYSICSISKLFTAIGVMQLRDANKLALRDPVQQHLEWFDIKQAHSGSPAITVESLLTHSSGLPRESDFLYWNAPDFPFPTRQQMIEQLEQQETLYPAQSLFQYSNLALSLAGEVIQSASGRVYNDYVQDEILEPLGLDDTRPYYPEQLKGEQLAVGYTGIHRSGDRDPVNSFFTRGISAAAGFTSSVNDLASFASWQFRLLGNGGKEVLDANTLREMHRVHWIDPDWETTWGLGFAVRRVEDTTVVSHGGGCPGYITSFTMVPEHKTAAIVLTNAGDGPAGRLAQGILKTFLPALAKASEPVDDTIPDLSAYEGNYEGRPWGGESAVRQWGDQLVSINLPSDELDDNITQFESEGNHVFRRLTDKGEPRETITFSMDDSGRATSAKVHSFMMYRID